jgi:hypothetical protein
MTLRALRLVVISTVVGAIAAWHAGTALTVNSQARADPGTDSARQTQGLSVFDTRPGHAWDQAREIFYSHRFPTGEIYEHPHAFAPPWTEFVPFVHDATFHEQVLARLEAVEKLPPAQLEEQSVARRLIFLRDLWPVFDGLHQALVTVPLDEEATAKAIGRRDELLRRVAGLMKRLELTEDEVRALPNALQLVGDKKLYPQSFDPSSPSEPFFPVELLDKDGPWVTYSREQESSAGGKLHMDFVNYRSLFTLHLLAPDGRDGGAKFLRDWTTSEGQTLVPPGTTLALLRRALVPTRSGKLLASPLVESLQLIVVTPPEDQRFKFTLDRPELLAGRLGLKLLEKDDPVDTSSFESLILPNQMALEPSKTEPPSESLIARRYKTLREIPSSLESCSQCHGGTTVRNRIFGSIRGKAAFLQSDPAQAAAMVVKSKEASAEWRLYLQLRDAAN